MQQKLDKRFDEKIEELEKSLPSREKNVNCAELTLTSVLQVLGIDDPLFHNAMIPLSGGFGGYKSKKGWQGACGPVSGGSSAIGIILGGHKRMDDETAMVASKKAAIFAHKFEKKFGSVICAELCGYDFSQPEGMIEYRKNGTWAKKCYHFVVWAVDTIRKITAEELKNNWE